MIGSRYEVRSMARALALMLILTVIGTVGFKQIGGADTTWVRALFMAAITLTTVGYSEVVPLSQSDGAQLFTIVYLVLGVGIFIYFFSNVTAFFVEGTLDRFFWRRKMSRKIARLTDHFIVCGGGKTGAHVVAELAETKRDFVLIEQDEERVAYLYEKIGFEFCVVNGDATEDDVLKEAGIDRATGLVTCLRNDKDNLVAVFSARQLSKSVRIVARCIEERDQMKLASAGADAVVSPNQIGGLRLVSEMVRPSAVSFLDLMLRDRDARFRVEEVEVHADTSLEGAQVDDLRSKAPDALVVAVRKPDGAWAFNPDANTRIVAGSTLILIAKPEGRAQLQALARST